MPNSAKDHSNQEDRNIGIRNHMDFSRVAWFTSGLIVGSILDTSTTMVLVVAWMLVSNEPLPKMLGGYYPQQIVSYIFRSIEQKLKKKHKLNNNDMSDLHIEEIDRSEHFNNIDIVGNHE